MGEHRGRVRAHEDMGRDAEVAAAVAEAIEPALPDIARDWAERMHSVFSDDSPALRLTTEQYATGMADMLRLIVARMKDRRAPEPFERLETLTQRAYAAGLDAADFNRAWILLEECLLDVVRKQHASGDPWPGCVLVRGEIDALRLKVNELYADITQRELRRSEERHRQLLRYASDAIITVDPATGQIISANLRTEALTGYSGDELRGMSLARLWPDRERRFARQLFETMASAGSQSAQAVPLTRQDGSTVPVDVSASVIDVGDGPIGLAILHDVSERVELERQRRIQAAELERRVQERTAQLAWLTSLNESIIQSMPSPMLVLDTDLRILRADEKCLAEWQVGAEEVEGKNVVEVFPGEVLEQQGLLEAIHHVASDGGSRQFDGVRWPSPDERKKLLNFRIRRVENGDAGQIILLWDDVTAVAERTYGLSLLYEIGQAMQRTRNMDRLLHAILTCLTAGPAIGLGLNRAFLLLIDENAEQLEGRMAVGPVSAEDAHRIWSDVAEVHKSLRDFLDADDALDTDHMPLHELVTKMRFRLQDGEQFITEALATRQPIVMSDARADPRVSQEFVDLLGCNEFVAVPLTAQDEPLGVIIADNLYSGRPITEEDLQLLGMFSAQAGIALANAAAYRDLELGTAELQATLEQLNMAQESLVRAQQLAAVGKMAARVAHEIRNPLTTVGGFARSILRDPTDRENAQQGSKIIVEELDRLEQILDNLLYVARPRTVAFGMSDINEIVTDTYQLLRDDFDGETWRLELALAPDLPPTLADARQLKQAFLNLAKNAAEAMPEGGQLTIRTWRDDATVAVAFSDTGVGLSSDVGDEIFELFFSTRAVGSGIGLFVTRQIVEEHGGSIQAANNPDVGATFTVHLPIREGP